MKSSRGARSLASWFTGLVLVFLGGCGTFPIRYVAGKRALEELQRTSLPAADFDEPPSALRELVGDEVERLALGERFFRRYDLDPEVGVLPKHLRALDSAPTRGFLTGDLVLAKNAKAQSLAMSLALAEPTYWDHLGVLVARDEEWFVYESEPDVRLLGSFPDFASRFQGEAEPTRFDRFADRYEAIAVVRLSLGTRLGAFVDAAVASADEGLRFDPYHDPERPELGCSEYVEELLRRAGTAFALAFTPPTACASPARAMRSLGFRQGPYLMPGAFLALNGARTIAVLARHERESQWLALRAAHEWLWQRQRATTPLGDLLSIHPTRLFRYSERSRAFLEWTKGAARDAKLVDLSDARRFVAAYGPAFLPDAPACSETDQASGRRAGETEETTWPRSTASASAASSRTAD